MFYIVKRRDLPQIRRLQPKRIVRINLHTLAINQRLNLFIHQLHQKTRHIFTLTILKPVEQRVPQNPPEEISPRQPIDAMLPVRDRPGVNLRVEMVGQLRQQAALNRERIVQVLFIEIFLRLLHEHAGYPLIIELRSPRPPDHLQNVRHREVHVLLQLGVEELRPLDDDQPGREVDPPGQGARRDQQLYFIPQKQVLHDLPVAGIEPGVVHADSEGEGLSQLVVGDLVDDEVQVLLRAAHVGAHCPELAAAHR